MQGVGGSLQNGSQAVTDVLEAPQNYFKGFANKTVGDGLTKAGQYLAGKTGLAATVGKGLTNLGTSMTAAGTGAGIGAGTTAAATGATTGAATGAATGATTGAAAGGTAAGGASGAAAAGPIGALVALGSMALTGANRKRAKQSSEALLGQTNQMAENAINEADNSLLNTQQLAAEQQAAANQDIINGIMTGGAAPVQKELSPVEEYQEYLRQNGYSDEAINGVPQGLNYGDKSVADWINQYNSGVGQSNPINIPQTAEDIAAAKAGTFNNTQSGQATQNIKNGIMNKFINGITDLAKGYDENRNTAFAPSNLLPDNNKSKMQRIGEAVGTAARIAQNPAVQGAVAGIAGGALTGNPLYGLGLAQKYAMQRANSNAYQNVLSQIGIPVNTGTFGNITSSDMQHIGNMVENKHRNDVWDAYYKDKIERDRDKLEADIDYKTKKLIIDQQNADSRKTNANANATRANKYGNGKGGSPKGGGNSTSYVIMEAPNGKRYKVPENQIKRYKAAGGKIVG